MSFQQYFRHWKFPNCEQAPTQAFGPQLKERKKPSTFHLKQLTVEFALSLTETTPDYKAESAKNILVSMHQMPV